MPTITKSKMGAKCSNVGSGTSAAMEMKIDTVTPISVQTTRARARQ